MSELNREPIEVPGATVPFFTYTIGETQYFEFDTSKCGPPEPMVNAMAGLKMIDSANKKVVMINHKKPMGLLDKIGENYDIETESMDDGRVKLIFSYKTGESEKADLSQTSCGG
ncbi:hypothetical protein [Sulfurovum riftiae]|uniref:DUF2249 domain-containing protein n=1 Tax=Sulfurovum riftiae TaxID=1630136 RepID=A0A151CHI7_9BACT|nr:hypothetical protein [Sulfurovum riftiae]KYJ86723.1 hypothetical protein AS592_07810 [Sulfurovum riftiae]